jgi:hypothetical protein
MDLRLPKLRTPTTSPRLGPTPLQQNVHSPKQVNLTSVIKSRDSVKLPRLDVTNAFSKPENLIQKVYDKINIDEESKFENLILTLQFVDTLRN